MSFIIAWHAIGRPEVKWRDGLRFLIRSYGPFFILILISALLSR